MRVRLRRSRLAISPRVPMGSRRLRLECLETRLVLSADCLSAISGIVALDTIPNGVVDPGEQLPDVNVQLYLDDGDGVFTLSDMWQQETQSDSSGGYRFDLLPSGSYFVVQPAQTIFNTLLNEQVSSLITLDTFTSVIIDRFETALEAPVTATSTIPVADGGNFAPEAIGGVRELQAFYFGQGDGFAEISVEEGNLRIVAVPSGDTFYTLNWDGRLDGTSDPTGLGGVDIVGGLTNAGVLISGYLFDTETALSLYFYTDESRFSHVELVQPGSMSAVDVFTPLTLLEGNADFGDVGLVMVTIEPTEPGASGYIDELSVIGGEEGSYDFLNPAPSLSAIDIEKSTNGVQADSPAEAVEIVVGDVVTWIYEVTNTGDADLFGVTVVDDQLGVVSTIISQGDGDNILQPQETWTYQATGVAEELLYSNLGTVTAFDPFERTVTDSDPSHYRGIPSLSAIDIEKSTNGVQADSPAEAVEIVVGDVVTWIYEVTNTGDADLFGVTVVDDQLGVVSTIISQGDGDNILQPQETWTYQATGVAEELLYSNLGTVTAFDPFERTVTDSDPSHYRGVCSASTIVTHTGDSGCGSLRNAITVANTQPGSQTITFAIGAEDAGFVDLDAGLAGGDPEPDVFVIRPIQVLPSLEDGGTIIDGTSQLATTGDSNPFGPEIAIDGEATMDELSSAFVVTSDNNQLRGLAIYRFDGFAVRIDSSDGEDNTTADANIVVGNYIGIDPLGRTAMGNGGGVGVFAGSDNIIGGDAPGERNMISGNLGDGIVVAAFNTGESASGNRIVGNLIGITATGEAAGNAGAGVFIDQGASDNLVGRTDEQGTANTIAFNSLAGVVIDGILSVGNAIRANSIFNNGGIGIDLGDDGPTPNDGNGDLDGGPNQLQNFPVLSRAFAGSSTLVSGSIATTPNTQILIEWFANAPVSTGENAEGARFLGAIELTTDELGTAIFERAAVMGSEEGEFITATATDPRGNTSEFSQAVVAQARRGSISGAVGLDQNRDRALDNRPASPGEDSPASGIVVNLVDANGMIVDSTTTGPDGAYQFDNLDPATYTVQVALVRREEQTFPVGQFASTEGRAAPLVIRAAAHGDFDADGDEDVAFVSEFPQAITIELNDGFGQFTVGQQIPLDRRANGLTATDFDGDGDLDLGIGLIGDGRTLEKGSVVILENRQGTFFVGIERETGNGPTDGAVADFNGDQLPDLAVANFRDDTITVLLNDGSGFAPGVEFATGAQPITVAAADVDDDGDIDLLVGNHRDDNVIWLANDGLGRFGSPIVLTSGIGPSDIEVGDIDGDNLPDVVVSYFGRTNNNGDYFGVDQLTIGFGAGAGSFTDQMTIGLPVGSRPEHLRLADVDADGDLDLAVSESERSVISIFENLGSRNFRRLADVDSAAGAEWFEPMLIDRDGNPDLMVAGIRGDYLPILYQRGDYEVELIAGEDATDIDFGIFVGNAVTPPVQPPASGGAGNPVSNLDVDRNGVISPLDCALDR